MNDLECRLKVFGFPLRILGGPVKDFKQESDKGKFGFRPRLLWRCEKQGLEGGETGGMKISRQVQ